MNFGPLNPWLQALARGILAAAILLLAVPQYAAAGEDEVVQALSLRHGSSHGVPSLEELETLAGGEDELVAILLKYRTLETPPFVGIRAEKLLLQYADRPDVADALIEDAESEEHFGLARIIGVHFDSVRDSSTRQRLARVLIERGKKEDRFARYARSLIDSEDSEVSRLAREAFPVAD